MTDKQLDTFYAVTQAGSFSKAEETLFISRQALIKQINALEAELHVLLFHRGKNGVVLTEAGKTFLAGLSPLRERMTQLIDATRSVAAHTTLMRIETPRHISTLLDEPIAVFRAEHPDIPIKILRNLSAGRIDRVLKSDVDIAEIPFTEECIQESLSYLPLRRNPYYCLMENVNPLARKHTIQACDLNHQTVLVNTRIGREDVIRYLLDQNPEILFSVIKGDEYDAVLNTCFSGGIFLTPAYYVTKIDFLTAVPLDCPITREIGLLTRAKQSPAQKLFVDTVLRVLR